MKKFLIIFSIFFIVISLYIAYYKNDCYKVLKIISPLEIYIDYNKNLILDENKSFKINNIYFVDRNSDLLKYPILKDLNEKEKLLLDYNARKTAQNLLNHKFIKVKNGNILINNENYTNLLIKSGFFYDDSEISQRNIIETIKKFNFNEYMLYNTKSKKYHTLDCPEAYKVKNYKIIKKSEINENFIPCKNCIIKKNDFYYETENKKSNQISDVFKTENINIYFIDLNKIMKPTNKCQTNACLALKNEIDNTKNTLELAIYGIDNQPEILNAIINAQNRGVKVRAVFDYDKKNFNYYNDTEKLQKSVPNYNTDKEYDLNNRSAIMHNKFFIFDDKKVFTGSTNITSTGITGFNSNISLLINSKETAQIFKREFNQMYNGKFHTQKCAFQNKNIYINPKTQLTVLFSPQDKIITNYIIPIIAKAKTYIYIPIFYITKKELITALTDAHKRGVEIKVINDATNAHNKYSIHKELRNAGIKVKTENYAGKMHSKALIIDDKYSIIGSMNFSNNGEKRNDENVVIINNKEITKYLKDTFLYLWNKIPSKYEKYDPQAESTESIGSCSDNIDNDFDEKIDKADEGCLIH